MGESGRSVSTHARIQQSSAPPEDLTLLCRRLVREPEESSYFVGGNTRGVRRGGNAPATSSSTPVARPPVAQSSVAQLPAAAAGVQPSSTPPGLMYIVVPAGGVSHGNLAADSAAAAVNSPIATREPDLRAPSSLNSVVVARGAQAGQAVGVAGVALRIRCGADALSSRVILGGGGRLGSRLEFGWAC